jgi:hypothetical protein
MSPLLRPGHFRGKRASAWQVCAAPRDKHGDVGVQKRASPWSMLGSNRSSDTSAATALWNYGSICSSSSCCCSMTTSRNFSSDTVPSSVPTNEPSRVVSKVRKRQRPHSRPWTTRQRLRRLITHNQLMRDRNVFTSFLAFPTKRSASPSSETLKELTAVAKSRWQWVANRVVSVWKEATDGKDVVNTPQTSSNRRPEKYEVIMDERWWFWNILLASLPATLIFVYCEFRGQYLAQDYFRQEELRQMRRILGDHITEHDLPPPPPPPWSARVYQAAGDAFTWLWAACDQYLRTLVDPPPETVEPNAVPSAAPTELPSATSSTMTTASGNVLASGKSADPDVDKSTLPWWFFMLPQAIHPLKGPPPVNASDHASTTPPTIVPTRSEVQVTAATSASPDQLSVATNDQTEPVTLQVLLKRIEKLEERINKDSPNVEQTTEPVPVAPQPAHNGVAASYPAERVRQSGVQNRYEDSLLQKWQHQRLESLSVRADSVDQTSSAGSSSAASLESVSQESSPRTVDLKSDAVGVHGNNAPATGAFSWMGVWQNFRGSPSQNMDTDKKQA